MSISAAVKGTNKQARSISFNACLSSRPPFKHATILTLSCFPTSPHPLSIHPSVSKHLSFSLFSALSVPSVHPYYSSLKFSSPHPLILLYTPSGLIKLDFRVRGISVFSTNRWLNWVALEAEGFNIRLRTVWGRGEGDFKLIQGG